MSALALKALTLASNFLEDRIRGKVYADLKHSDVTGQHFREFILRTLDDVQDKLDGLSRMDLLTSLHFFKDGITLLYGFIESSKGKEGSEKSEQDDEAPADEIEKNKADEGGILMPVITKSLAALGFTSGQSEAESATVGEPSEELNSDNCDASFITESKNKFQKSAEHATKAISNEALKIADRIFASRLRIISTLLEHIENTAVALTLCRSYIEQLNSLEEVVNTFGVQFGTGASVAVKKRFNHDERKELVWSVIAINRTMWHYARIFGADATYFTNWPRVTFGDGDELHAVLDSRVRELFQVFFGEGGDREWMLNCPQGIAVDADCNVVVADTCNNRVKVFSPIGRYMYCCEVPQEIEGMDHFWPRCVTIDKQGTGDIFSGSSRGRREDFACSAKVVVFDKHGKFKNSFGADVFNAKAVLTSVLIDQNNRLLISDDSENCIHMFNLDGQYQSKVCNWDIHEGCSHIAVTTAGLMLVTHWDHIRIYDKEGAFVSKFLAKDHGLPLEGIVFDPQHEWIYVFSKAYKHLDKFRTPNIQIYNKEWNLIGTIQLSKLYRTSKAMALTPDGFVAVVNVDENEVSLV